MSEIPAIPGVIDLHEYGWQAVRDALPIVGDTFFDREVDEILKISLKANSRQQPDGNGTEIFAMVVAADDPGGITTIRGYTILDGKLIFAAILDVRNKDNKTNVATTSFDAERELGMFDPSIDDAKDVIAYLGKLTAAND